MNYSTEGDLWVSLGVNSAVNMGLNVCQCWHQCVNVGVKCVNLGVNVCQLGACMPIMPPTSKPKNILQCSLCHPSARNAWLITHAAFKHEKE